MRPSLNSTHIEASSKRTDLAEIFMPGPQQAIALLADDTEQEVQVTRIKPVILGDGNLGLEPDFCLAIAAADVNMRRLARISFVGEESEAEAVTSEHCRHDGFPLSGGQLHPVVPPHVSHFKHVPFRTIVKFPHSGHASPT